MQLQSMQQLNIRSSDLPTNDSTALLAAGNMYSVIVTESEGSSPSSQNLLYFALTLGSATDAIFVHKVLTSVFILILSYLQMVSCHSFYQTTASRIS